jgi:type IV pilus assembly protein PilB
MSKLIETLVKERLISEEQLIDAKDKQLGAKKPLHELLVDMGFLSEEDLIKVASRTFNMPVVDLASEVNDPALIKLIPYETAKRYGVFPVRIERQVLVIATSDPQDVIALDDIKAITKMPVKTLLATKAKIAEITQKYYHADDVLYDILKNIGEEPSVELMQGIGDQAIDLALSERGSAPVIRLVDVILSDAVRSRASDIHIEPAEQNVYVRYRIDGELNEIMKFSRSLVGAVVARIKIIGRLDIAETRKSQDGRVRVLIDERNIDLRISIVPTIHGENAELRILDPQEAKISIDKIGFEANDLEILIQAAHKPQGIILVTGPTGSGKTSTLYAALNSIKGEKKNIMAIEDPVEYIIDGISQIQVNLTKDVTFANGLRSILRQDPNVILVGEIRDRDTADIAFRSSLTGHLVFSTLHTNNAVASITRLLNIGLEPYLISSSLTLIVAQRLVKVICADCKQEYAPDSGLLEKFREYLDKAGVDKFYHGTGCKKCDYTGYYGRTAIFEMLPLNERIRSIINDNFSEAAIAAEAGRMGFRTLSESAINKVGSGITTLSEVARVAEFLDLSKTAQKEGERKRKLVIIADDEEDILKILDKRLSSAGFDSLKARDGAELIELAVRERPDLIISDVTMPKMNGFEAIKVLRSKLETAVIPIILLTGRQDKESEIKGLDAGADDYIVKPFDGDKLVARAKMLLRRK